MCVWVDARLPQRLKSMFFETFFFTPRSLQGPPLEIFSKTLILAQRQTVLCPAKMDFFPRFSSLCTDISDPPCSEIIRKSCRCVLCANQTTNHSAATNWPCHTMYVCICHREGLVFALCEIHHLVTLVRPLTAHKFGECSHSHFSLLKKWVHSSQTQSEKSECAQLISHFSTHFPLT